MKTSLDFYKRVKTVYLSSASKLALIKLAMVLFKLLGLSRPTSRPGVLACSCAQPGFDTISLSSLTYNTQGYGAQAMMKELTHRTSQEVGLLEANFSREINL